ncbi:hypothetical protein XI25_01365 [Paenibacillus sp. DMB20]|nr:hypothetical protein XI25_01365 [Paenibacillus sp. DMB20]
MAICNWKNGHAIMMTAAAVVAVGAIGTSTATWAAKLTPKVNTDTNQTYSIIYEGVRFLKYSTLTPDEQKFVTEKGLRGLYALVGYEHLVPEVLK